MRGETRKSQVKLMDMEVFYMRFNASDNRIHRDRAWLLFRIIFTLIILDMFCIFVKEGKAKNNFNIIVAKKQEDKYGL